MERIKEMGFKEKRCVICGKLFIPNSSRQLCCSKECYKEYRKEYSKQYYIKNKEYYKELNKQWMENNKEHRKEYKKQYYQENKEHVKQYHQENKTQINEYEKQRKRTDPNYKMSRWCRTHIYRCLKSKKTKHTFDILGYTPDELRLHLELQFKEDMSWENHGILWHIDHIKPLCLFNFINEDGTPNYDTIREANSLDNLQPLYIEENLSKGGYYDEAC